AAVLEYGLTEILLPVGAISKHTAHLCRPGRQAGRAHPRGRPGFSNFESGCGRETDCLLEGRVSCELVSEGPIPCYHGKYSELRSAAGCGAGRAVNSSSVFKVL